MSNYSIVSPKIDPGKVRPDGSPDDNDRTEIGPTKKAFQEWQDLGIATPNLERMRRTRLQRIVDQLNARQYDGVLLFDPLNIRYATDSTNMQLWVAHNPARACFVSAAGDLILWDFHGCDHLSAHLNLITDHRHGAGFFYFVAGDQEPRLASEFATDVDQVMQQYCGSGRRLAIDKIEISGLEALQQRNFSIQNGQQLMEHARLVKGIDEINAMRCAVATCEIAIEQMHRQLAPGIAEVELWSVLHGENIARGGEWIETRILNSGPRTNPWMQEAGPREIQNGDLLAFDTDLIGPYGMCCDMSRTWYCGDGTPATEQQHLFQVAHDHIMTNAELLGPGVSFKELAEKGQRLPEKYRAQRYGVMMHGVGLCDEFPAIYYPEDYIEGAFDYVLEPGMMICVEAYIGAVGGQNGVKLEDQILITDSGHEWMTHYPYDEKLLAAPADL